MHVCLLLRTSLYDFIFQALDRELKPVEDRINKLDEMASTVMQSSPRDCRQVQSRVVEITSMWDKLKSKTAARETQLHNAHLMHSFMADSRDLVSVCVV